MDVDRGHMTEKILDLTLEILCLLTGEVYGVVKMASIECLLQGLYPMATSGKWSKSLTSIMEPPTSPTVSSMILERDNDKKILEVTKKMMELLTGEVPIRCQEVSVEERSDGHMDTMMENHLPLTSPDSSEQAQMLPTDGDIKEEPESIKEEGLSEEGFHTEVDYQKVRIEEEDLLGGDHQNYGSPPSPPSLDSQGHLQNLHHKEEPEEAPCETEHGSVQEGTGDPENEAGDEGRARTAWSSSQILEVGPYICDGCGSVFPNASSFLHHQSICEGPRFQCEMFSTNDSKSLLLEHQHTHIGVRSFKEPETRLAPAASHSFSENGKDFGNSSSLVQTEENPYACSECGKCFPRKSLLISHFTIHSTEKPYSSKSTILNTSLSSHQSSYPGAKPYSCSECGKCFSESGHLTVHKRIHAGQKSYACSECGKAFPQKSLLISHQRTHTGAKPYSCSECGKCYSQSGHLTVHKRIHSGEKPYSCSECGKSFCQRSLLIYHQRIHTGERPYACPVCGKCFTHRANLGVHQRIHLGEKPFSCTECGKRFINKWGLINHRRTHTGERPYPCPECGKCFSRSPNLLRHRRVHLAERSFVQDA